MREIIVRGAEDIINALTSNKILYSAKHNVKYYMYKNLILSNNDTAITINPPIDTNEVYLYYE